MTINYSSWGRLKVAGPIDGGKRLVVTVDRQVFVGTVAQSELAPQKLGPGEQSLEAWRVDKSWALKAFIVGTALITLGAIGMPIGFGRGHYVLGGLSAAGAGVGMGLFVASLTIGTKLVWVTGVKLFDPNTEGTEFEVRNEH